MAASEAPDWRHGDNLPAIVADAERHAAFLADVGAELLVAGLPMRQTFGTRPPFFVDAAYMTRMADIAHLAGEAVAVARRHRRRIALAHWKDAVKPIDVELTIDETVFAQQQPYMTELGTGIVDWRGWAEAMSRRPAPASCSSSWTRRPIPSPRSGPGRPSCARPGHGRLRPDLGVEPADRRNDKGWSSRHAGRH